VGPKTLCALLDVTDNLGALSYLLSLNSREGRLLRACGRNVSQPDVHTALSATVLISKRTAAERVT
jgi:hypothetical protein